MEKDMIDFKTAYELPIGKHVEKKGKFSYLSWSHAVKFLRENLPDAQWIIHENADGLPIFNLAGGVMVKVSVVIDGAYFTQWHPVLNHQNKPMSEPSTFDINTSIQRCLTKAIGLATGIGLGLYAGEDLPVEDKNPPKGPITETQLTELEAEINERVVDVEKLLAFAKVDNLSAIDKTQFNSILTAVKSKPAKEAL